MGPAATEDELAAMAYELPEEPTNEQMVVNLYLRGDITLEGATQLLGVERDEFLTWVDFARSMERAPA